jgi:hypothetical protein
VGSSFSQQCEHSLILPIHGNQAFSRNKEIISKFQRLRRSAKPFGLRKPKAVWHGGRNGHAKLQQEIALGWFGERDDLKNTSYNGKSTQRDLAIQLSQASPESLDASFDYISIEQWKGYQAWLSLDGNSYAGNTLEALVSGSVMMRHAPRASFQWFEPILVPNEHYVPIEYDLSDVVDRVHWLKSNPLNASRIAERAVHLGETIAERRVQLCYSRAAQEIGISTEAFDCISQIESDQISACRKWL